MTDFSNTLFRASAVYYIMAGENNAKTPLQKWQSVVDSIPILEARFEQFKNKECKSALEVLQKIEIAKESADELYLHKDEVWLSEGAKSFLAKVYAAEKYGKWSTFKDKGNKYTVKGQMAEEEAILFISRLDSRYYIKNDVRINNDFVTGVPDVVVGDSPENIRYVIDVKSPYDIETFIANLGKPLNPLYWWQIQTYMWLTGAKQGEVSFCLMNTPEYILNSERRRLFDRMGVATEDDAQYQKALKTLENNLLFDDMPIPDRRIKFVVDFDESIADKIAAKVIKCREYLAEIEELHLFGTKEEVKLVEMIEEM